MLAVVLFPSSLDLSVFFTVSLLLFTKHIALLNSYLSICFLGVYSVIFGFKFKNSTDHYHNDERAILDVLRFQDVPLLRPKFMLPKREKRPLIDPKEPMLPM